MKQLTGISASKGIAIGQMFFYENKIKTSFACSANDPVEEQQRFDEARTYAIQCLDGLRERAMEQVGKDQSKIFEIHQLLLQDEDYLDIVQLLIAQEHCTAEFAVQRAGEQLAAIFSSIQDDYLRERGADVRDISNRLLHVLCGRELINPSKLGGQFILASHDLMPSDIILMDKSKVLGFVSRDGSRVSHSSILARTMGIPAIVRLGKEQYQQLNHKDTIIIDGFLGHVIVNPDERTLTDYRAKCAQYQSYRERLKRLKGVPSKTMDGTKIYITANIGSADEVETALENDAQGIGVFRTEFLYSEKEELPGEQMQFEVYQSVLQRMKDETVVVRTLDMGEVKTLPSFGLPYETNPLMGCRGIRNSLRRPQIFATQLRALLRASVYGHLRIMLPLVMNISEVRTCKTILEDCKKDLDMRGLPYDPHIPLGLMIETPAAVLTAEVLAKSADFFCIGTNDLTQFVLGVDRANGSIGSMFDYRHPAVLRLIEIAVRAARDAGIPCAVAGDAAADRTLTAHLLSLGVTSLSVQPPAVLEIREQIRSIDLSIPSDLLMLVGQ